MTKELDQTKENTNVTYLPKADILLNDEGARILLELPGVKKENLTLEVKKGRLQVHGQVENPGQGDKLHGEYGVGNFRRSFEISEELDLDSAQAKLEDGILEIKLDKHPEAQPKAIKVS